MPALTSTHVRRMRLTTCVVLVRAERLDYRLRPICMNRSAR
jgi:hypothetical protein